MKIGDEVVIKATPTLDTKWHGMIGEVIAIHEYYWGVTQLVVNTRIGYVMPLLENVEAISVRG